MISFECLESHPAFVRPPIDRHGVAELDTITHLPVEDLLASPKGVRRSALLLCPFFSCISLERVVSIFAEGLSGENRTGDEGIGGNSFAKKKIGGRNQSLRAS